MLVLTESGHHFGPQEVADAHFDQMAAVDFTLADGPEEEPADAGQITVWDDIHSRLSLTAADREHLKRKRGFTAEQIERGGFVSSGKDNRALLQPILSRWPIAMC